MATKDADNKDTINEEIDKETLLSLLKDKSKEIKSLTTKLNKIEEKYVKIFKEHKNLSKDRETTEKNFLNLSLIMTPRKLPPLNPEITTSQFSKNSGINEKRKKPELPQTKSVI